MFNHVVSVKYWTKQKQTHFKKLYISVSENRHIGKFARYRSSSASALGVDAPSCDLLGADTERRHAFSGSGRDRQRWAWTQAGRDVDVDRVGSETRRFGLHLLLLEAPLLFVYVSVRIPALIVIFKRTEIRSPETTSPKLGLGGGC